MAMDAKDLRVETSVGNNDGSKYSDGVGLLQCDRNKHYQDVGPSALGKVEGPPTRPCAVIGPDRVLPRPAVEPYPRKAPIDAWPPPDNPYGRPPEYPYKILNDQNPVRNISPRQTFQENMQRIMVQPRYSAANASEDPNFSIERAMVSKNSKLNVPSEAKYCDVPYPINHLNSEHKNMSNTDFSVNQINPAIVRNSPWPPNSVGLRPMQPYGVSEMYQYPEYQSCAVPGLPHPTRQHKQDEAGPVYTDSYYNERFKPYPNVKERYPPPRYEYINKSYQNPHHSIPIPFPTHRYDLKKIHPHAYTGYPQVPLKYMDGRLPEPLAEGYPRQSSQHPNYNMPVRNPVIHPAYGPMPGNCLQNKMYPYPRDHSVKGIIPNKSLYDNKMFEYESGRNKMYHNNDNSYVNEIPRSHLVKSQVMPPNYSISHGLPPHLYYRKDHTAMRNYEYYTHMRNMDPNLCNPMARYNSQFSPNTISISPSDSNTSNDTVHTQGTSHDDCGYVSQSPAGSVRSIESDINRYIDPYRRYYHKSNASVHNSHLYSKTDSDAKGHSSSKSKKDLDVRQFLQMWNEGEEENSDGKNEEINVQVKYNEEARSVKQCQGGNNQDQLYVLDLVNVPTEELSKYEHIQKVSKLPENIKGYNSIELLDQFEEAIGSSNFNLKENSYTSEEAKLVTRVNRPVHETVRLSRPVSPLDVESKISQSVIHKEVGCNFEIKPCSPKMMSAELAAPLQKVLDERTIEKVSNPITVKFPVILHTADENNVKNNDHLIPFCNENIQNQSCQLMNMQYSNEENGQNYTLQDLESNSSVCLASLPRLDTDIELNFTEVNQQFINANKTDAEPILTEFKDLPTLSDLDSSEIIKKGSVDQSHPLNFALHTPTMECENEFLKLSKFRKLKKSSEETKDIQAARTDSVIIKNPDNVPSHEPSNFSSCINIDSLNEKLNYNDNDLVGLESDLKPELKHSENIEKVSVPIDVAINFSLHSNKNEEPIVVNDLHTSCTDVTNKKQQAEECSESQEKKFVEDMTVDTNSEFQKYDTKIIANSNIDKNDPSCEDDICTEISEKTTDNNAQTDGSHNIISSLNKEKEHADNPCKNKSHKTSFVNPNRKSDFSKISKSFAPDFRENDDPINKNKLNQNNEILPVISTNSCFEIIPEEDANQEKCLDKYINKNSGKDLISKITVNDSCSKNLSYKTLSEFTSKPILEHKIGNNEVETVSNSLIKFVNNNSKQDNETSANKTENYILKTKPHDDDASQSIQQDCLVPNSINTTTNEKIATIVEINQDTFFGENMMCSGPEEERHKALTENSNGFHDSDKRDECNLESSIHSICVPNSDIEQGNNVRSTVGFDCGNGSGLEKEQCKESKADCIYGSGPKEKRYIKSTKDPVGIYDLNSEESRNTEFTVNLNSRYDMSPEKELDMESSVNSSACPDASLANEKEYTVNSKCIHDSAAEDKRYEESTFNFNCVNNIGHEKGLNVESTVNPKCVHDSDPEKELKNPTVNSKCIHVSSPEEDRNKESTFNLNCVLDPERDLYKEHAVNPNSILASVPEEQVSTVNSNNVYNLEPDKEPHKKSTMRPNCVYDSSSEEKRYIESTVNSNSLIDSGSEDEHNTESTLNSNGVHDSDSEKDKDSSVNPNCNDDSDSGEECNIKSMVNLNCFNDLDQKIQFSAQSRLNSSCVYETPKESLPAINDYENYLDLDKPNIETKKEVEALNYEMPNIPDNEVKSNKSDIEEFYTPSEVGIPDNLEAYCDEKKPFYKKMFCPRIQKLLMSDMAQSLQSCIQLNECIKDNSSNIDRDCDCNSSEHRVNDDNICNIENELIECFISSNRNNCSNNLNSEGHNNECYVPNAQILTEDYDDFKKTREECVKSDSKAKASEYGEDKAEKSEVTEIKNFDINTIKKGTEIKIKSDTKELNYDVPKKSHAGETISTFNISREVDCLNKFQTAALPKKKLKRSLSESMLYLFNSETSEECKNLPCFSSKRHKIRGLDDSIQKTSEVNSFCKYFHTNRRNSVSSTYTEDNVSFCILIDENCIISEECDDVHNNSFTEISEDRLSEIREDDAEDHYIVEETSHEDEITPNSIEESWVEDVSCVETVLTDIAEDVVISTSSSPNIEDLEYESNNESSDINNSDEVDLMDQVKYIYGSQMCNDDAQFVETLYHTPQMDVKRTLIDKESHATEDNYDSSKECYFFNDSPTSIHNSDSQYLEKECSSAVTEFIDPSNKEETACKHSVIDKSMYDDNITTAFDNFENTDNLDEPFKKSCESSNETFFSDCEDSQERCASSSSPEVSSTTSEDKCSGILLKITNYKGSRISQINNNIKSETKLSCKFTENSSYSSTSKGYTRPLLTKAAQKYIPPLKETIGDLKVKLPLPQQRLIKLKLLKTSKDKPKPDVQDIKNICNKNNRSKEFVKKPKPKFEDVLKSIDKTTCKMLKERSKKGRKLVPKVFIKKNENGSHYASTSHSDNYNPDLTGRKWQPWVFLEKNNFIDKMAIKRKTKAIFNYRKNTYVLAEKFYKYKSFSSSTKFIINHQKVDESSNGKLKYTIRLKHSY